MVAAGSESSWAALTLRSIADPFPPQPSSIAPIRINRTAPPSALLAMQGLESV
jgi:hypothetical protein